MSTTNLFTLTFITMMGVYLYVFGQDKTIELIKAEYLFVLALIPLTLSLVYLKFKLKAYKIIDFAQNDTFSFKTTILFFVAFQVYDYISYDGFKGMITQWFIYWVMGLIALLIIQNINYYKNYQLIYKTKPTN